MRSISGLRIPRTEDRDAVCPSRGLGSRKWEGKEGNRLVRGHEDRDESFARLEDQSHRDKDHGLSGGMDRQKHACSGVRRVVHLFLKLFLRGRSGRLVRIEALKLVTQTFHGWEEGWVGTLTDFGCLSAWGSCSSEPRDRT